jgi:hypothetical protein
MDAHLNRLTRYYSIAAGLIPLLVIALLSTALHGGEGARVVIGRRFGAPSTLYWPTVALGCLGAAYLLGKRDPRARTLVVLLSFPLSAMFPLGTMLAGYSWWVMRSVANTGPEASYSHMVAYTPPEPRVPR